MAFLIRAQQPRVAAHIGGEDRVETADRRPSRAAVDCLNQSYPKIGTGPSVQWAGQRQARAVALSWAGFGSTPRHQTINRSSAFAALPRSISGPGSVFTAREPRASGCRGMINAPGCFEFMDRASHYRHEADHARRLAEVTWQPDLEDMLRRLAQDLTRPPRISKLVRPRCVTPSFCRVPHPTRNSDEGMTPGSRNRRPWMGDIRSSSPLEQRVTVVSSRFHDPRAGVQFRRGGTRCEKLGQTPSLRTDGMPARRSGSPVTDAIGQLPKTTPSRSVQ
jgi:hypothetical protein